MSGLKPFRHIPNDMREWATWMRSQSLVATDAVEVTAGMVDADSATENQVLTADGDGGAAFSANPYLSPPAATTTELANAGHSINTTDKEIGRMVFNTTTSKPVWAVGAASSAVWVDATGTTAHSPS